MATGDQQRQTRSATKAMANESGEAREKGGEEIVAPPPQEVPPQEDEVMSEAPSGRIDSMGPEAQQSPPAAQPAGTTALSTLASDRTATSIPSHLASTGPNKPTRATRKTPAERKAAGLAALTAGGSMQQEPSQELLDAVGGGLTATQQVARDAQVAGSIAQAEAMLLRTEDVAVAIQLTREEGGDLTADPYAVTCEIRDQYDATQESSRKRKRSNGEDAAEQQQQQGGDPPASSLTQELELSIRTGQMLPPPRPVRPLQQQQASPASGPQAQHPPARRGVQAPDNSFEMGIVPPRRTIQDHPLAENPLHPDHMPAERPPPGPVPLRNAQQPVVPVGYPLQPGVYPIPISDGGHIQHPTQLPNEMRHFANAPNIPTVRDVNIQQLRDTISHLLIARETIGSYKGRVARPDNAEDILYDAMMVLGRFWKDLGGKR
ncbi:uncharacterized protein RCC_00772 [Ramularia collo-cygni]|uniref:Uncharacterized protein n=1 Tax=Ramularia collo-cygni TaxID=112498 RepID=A0A2D3USX4_9PEZI|nr:uncharacterized protein RCC_00772 [Ramularia collo-cygni]CZT14827.1 uncharacterized protein RCC_00772 [Ramularia collo-cygni]